MFDLSGQTALVTGASGGIGGAIARALHRPGGGADAGRHARRSAPRRSPPNSASAPMSALADLADPRRRDQLVKTGRGGARAVSTSSSTMPASTRDALALRMKDEDWQAVLDVDLTAAFRLTRAALRGMVRRRHGRIIGVTSVVGVTGNPGQANYAAAKAAMIGMSKSIAAEVAGRGITVNCVAPGLIATAMTDKLTRGSARPPRRGDSRRAGSARPRTSPPRSSIWPAPRPPTSPAKPCTSTAAWPWYSIAAPGSPVQPNWHRRGNHVM